MDLRQLWGDFRQNLVVAIIVFLGCATVGLAAAYLPAKQYQATTSVVAQPLPGTPDPVGAVAVIQYVLPLLPEEATNADTLATARKTVPPAFRGKNVSIASSTVPGTGVVQISATASSPAAAAAYANAVAARVSAEQPQNALYALSQLSLAKAPASPSNPRLPTVIGAAGFGLIAAVFAALIAAGIRRRLSRVTEVRERIGASVVGQIPRMRRDLKPIELFAPGAHNLEVEAFQELRSNLLVHLPSDRRPSIAVTSCDPSEGKTSITANIAWALASPDLPVVAVDCDMRRPMLHLRFGVPLGPGVAGGIGVHGLAHVSPTVNPHLGVIPAGITDRHPADIVSANMPGILEELHGRHQTVVIDCPPVVGVAETVLLASLVDVVLVVVDTRRFHPERLQHCLARLEDAGATIGGVVLNRVRVGGRNRGGTSGYRYPLEQAKSGGSMPAPERPPGATADYSSSTGARGEGDPLGEWSEPR